MKKIKDILTLAVSVLMLGATIALAAFDPVNDDTDIFLANPNVAAERPNVLIVLDNTANWNTPFDNEKAALRQVVNSLSDSFNVGMMIMSDSNIKRTGPGGSDGAYVRSHVRRMTLANKTVLASIVENFNKQTDKGDNNLIGLALYEAYLYFAGKASRAGDDQHKADHDGTDNEAKDLTSHALPGLSGTDTFPTENALYRSPITDGCQRNFVIFISNGPANENATARAELETKLGTLTGVSPPAVISITPNGQQSNWADEMAKFMANADVFATTESVPNSAGVQNIYTYTVEIDPEAGANIISVTTATAHGFAVNDPVTISGTTNFNDTYTVNSIESTTKFNIVATITPSPATEIAGDVSGKAISSISQASSDMTALLKSVAANGKGKYFGVSSGASGTAIVDALNAIFVEVQAVNSVFASTTLPVSVNVRGTNLNQVYIGVFRPDQTKSPRWLGNLKMYNLALNSATGAVFLADAANDAPPHASPPPTGNQAENSTTGFVSQNSPSFWTDTSSFWGFRPPSANGPGGASDLPDGDLVEKGGAAQQLRVAFAGAEASSPGRNLYTCTSGLVSGATQNCLPNIGFQLSSTPFATTNDAISPAALQLDTRLVSPLTAYATQSVTSITDRLPVLMSNTWAGTGGRLVTSLNNAAVSASITTLTTAVPKVVSSLTGVVTGTITVNVTNIAKDGNTYVVTTDAAFSGVVNGTTVLPNITCTTGSTGFNSLSAANRTVSAHTTSAPFTYTIPGPSSGNHACSAGTVQGPGPVNSTTAQATVGAHGYVSGQAVTISGATPVQFNGTFNVDVIDADHFNYTIATAAGDAGLANPLVAIKAAGNTTTATATTAAPHTFASGSTVTITGASDPAYNGVKTITCSPAPLCAGATDFTYSVGATAIAPNTNTSGVTATQGGGTSVTVTTSGTHFFADGDTIFLSGSDIAGYNKPAGFVITCPGCDPLLGSTASFSISTAPDVLAANSSTLVYAAKSVSARVLAYAPNHGLVAGDSIRIEGAAPIGDVTYTVGTNFGLDYYFDFNTGTAQPPITSSGYTVRHSTDHKAWVTITGGHGYTNGQEVRIAGASPSGYDLTQNIRVCPGGTAVSCTNHTNVFSYPLTALQGTNTSGGVTASIKTTLAKATSVNHGFGATGSTSTVAILGATPAAFNGTKTITVTGPDNFTYPIDSAEGDASGKVTAGQASGSSVERDNIINWVRGQDNLEDENSNSSTADIRASVHGDVLHSRPAVVNYSRYYKAGGLTPASATDTKSDDDVFVFYGGNDGVFHAVKGGYAVPAGDTSGLTPGREAWGFVPEEFFDRFKRLRNNAPIISSAFKRPYFMDGPIGVYTLDADSPPDGALGGTNDKVNLYIANRRGGRFLYALDVNTPTNPKFLWRITNDTTGFGELGYTWSQPTVINGLAGLKDPTGPLDPDTSVPLNPLPVLVFGAGYDPDVEDLKPSVIIGVDTTTGAVITSTVGTVSRTMGRGIYVVNALTGALIWSAGGTGSGATTEVPGMVYAIPSDLTVVRNESGGFINRAYVGDTGGNMWRIDFRSDATNASPNLDASTVTKLASVADTTTTATITDPDTLESITVLPGLRKFLFPPDVVGDVGFDMVLIGSGDREHPFDTSVTNRFYMFKDKGLDTGAVIGTAAATCDPTITEGPIADDADACTPNPGAIPGLSDLTLNCIQNPDSAGCVAAGLTDVDALSAKLAADRGWFISLGAGEKVVGNAISISGTTFFNTNQPSATAGGGTCGSNLGVARQYQVATADATSTSDLNAVGGLTGEDRSLIHAGGGYLPSPVHVVVMLGGKPVEAVISGIQVSTPAGASLSARLRKFWYKEVDPR